MLPRQLNLLDLLSKKSHFLFGARGSGKTSVVRAQLGQEALIINLLDSDYYLRLAARPSELEQIIDGSNSTVVIDEIQKIPALLDEVHRLIEEKKRKFLLTGSSARKLRRGGANLLAGRAWTANLFPLTSNEIPEFNLNRFLHYGGLPAVYLSQFPDEELNAYVHTYLTEEIAAEGLVRDLPLFSNFLRKAALSNGSLINFSEIGSDIGVSPTTIREYYRILDDTLVGHIVEPLRGAKSRKEVSTAKFYFFDVGVANILRSVKKIEEGTDYFGTVFEQFIAQELRAAISYQRLYEPLRFWRTHTQLEVDFVIGDLLAAEIKSTTKSSSKMAKGLKAFSENYQVKHRCLVSRDPVERIEDGIRFLPYNKFLNWIWSGDWRKE